MVKYIKQSDIEVYPNRCFSANLSAAYADAFDNSQPTADISNLPYKSGLLVEIPTSQTPPYGSGEAVGYKLGLYVNDITVTDYDNPTLTIWKSKRGITNNQGNFGQTIQRDIYAMCSYPSYSGDHFFTESFDKIKGGTTTRSGPGGQAVVDTGDYYVIAQHIFALRNKYAVRGHWKGNYEDWLDYWGTQLPNGLWVVFCDLGSKVGDTRYTRRKEWRLLDPNPGAPNPREGKNTHGYLAWDEGWGGGSVDLAGDGIDDEVRINITVKNTYQMNTRMEGIVAKPIDPSLTNFFDVYQIPKGTLMRFSDDVGDKELMQNGIFKDFSAASPSALFNSLAGCKITTADDAWDTEFQSIAAGGNGFLQVNCVTEDQIPMPVKLTMTHPRSSTQEQTSTGVDGIDTTVTMEIKHISEILAKSNTDGDDLNHAVFPSRGIAVWFKNHINAGKESKPNVMEDMYVNFYDETAGSSATGFVGMDDGPTTSAVSGNLFCGYFLYKYNGSFFIKSIGKENATYGTSLAGSAVAEVGTGMVPYNVSFDPDDISSGSGCTQLSFNPVGRLMHVHHRWTPGASNGFELIFEDASTGVILNDEIHIPTTHGGSPNDEYAMPYFSFATYNCAALGTGSNVNHRPLYNGYSTTQEQTVNDDTITQVEVSVDEISTSTYGLSYMQSNATITTDGLGGKLQIASRDGPDMSITLSKNDKRTQVSESETRTEQMHPTYLSFGFKTSDELKVANGGGKYIYYSGFQCSNNAGNAPIADSNMKWAWTTDATPLGKQLADDTGSNTDPGTMSSANTQFVIGTNLFFSSTGANKISTGPNPTPILINENFTQKGHMYITEANFTNHSKRENIFCSARVMGGFGRSNSGDSLVTNKAQALVVNSPEIFTKWKSGEIGADDETYRIYIYGKDNRPTFYRSGLILKGAQEITDMGGYAKMTFNKDVRYSDAYMAVTGASKTIQSDQVSGDHSDKELTFVNPKIGGTGDVIDLRDYFKAGDEITLANTTSNNGNLTIASLTNTVITCTTGFSGASDFSGDTDANIKHRVDKPDLLVHTIGDVRYDDFYFTFISPERYWIFGEIYNYDAEGNSLPMKTYDSVIMTDFRMDSESVGSADFTTNDIGASYSEFTVTDGIVDINEWDLTLGAAGGVLESKEDFGHGAYNWDEAGGGGYVAKWVPELSFDRSAQYNLIDISGYPVVPAGESVYLWCFPQQESSTSTINISTFNDTSNARKPFLLTVYDDQIPAHPKLSVKPYKEDGFIPQFNWDSSEDDLWYGLLFIDNSQINNQYHNYLYYIPLNEDLTGYADSQYASNIFLDRYDGTMSNPSDYLFTETASINSTARVIHTADSRIVDGVSVSGTGIPDGCYVDVISSTSFDLRNDPDTHDTLVNATQTIGTGGSGHTLTFGGTAEDRYDGLAGHSKRFSNATGNILKWTGAQTGVGDGNKFSFICHVIPDRGTISEETYIAYQNSTVDNDIDYSWFLALDSQGRVKLSIQGRYGSTNTNTVTELTSATILPRDNESPTMICWTLDNELIGSNVKLFINGILEASSGLLKTANTNSTNQWGTDVVIDTQSSDFFLGGYHTGTKADKAFSGKIEEIVAYTDVIYPVNPKDGEFIWRKPVKDFTGDKATPLSYVSRLFIKDYHNIRGRSTSDVAVSSPVSYMKPVLGNRGN